MDGIIYDAYVNILKEELVPGMGCTEPIAIAYAAAVARETLGSMPKSVRISARLWQEKQRRSWRFWQRLPRRR